MKVCGGPKFTSQFSDHVRREMDRKLTFLERKTGRDEGPLLGLPVSKQICVTVHASQTDPAPLKCRKLGLQLPEPQNRNLGCLRQQK